MLIPIKYIGKKESETDHLYGTGLTWAKGQTIQVPLEKAKLLLNHPDVWKDARHPTTRKKFPIAPEKARSRQLDDEDLRSTVVPKIHLMPREDLVQYAQLEFGERLDSSLPVEALRTEVVRLMHTRG